jgi:uncharacterized Zn finger protein
MYYEWQPYVPVAERRRKAQREMDMLKKKGHPVSPVVIEGSAIAKTFWGKAWCDNLTRYSDYSNRLPRGRTYVRNGSVVDLQIDSGEVRAMVSGSEIYRVDVTVSALKKVLWTSVCTDCAGAIDSLVELLQGRFSKGVMERICQQQTGLFPSSSEIEFSCSCPDSAYMCKHVAAVLYGIGARLDQQPELLFKLRKVNENDLIAKAGKGLPLSKGKPAREKVLQSDDLSQLFGLELDTVKEVLSLDNDDASVLEKPARSRRASKRVPKVHKRTAASETSSKRSASRIAKKAPKTKPKSITQPKTKRPPKR